MRTLTNAPLLEGSILQEQIDLETRAVRDGVIRYRQLAARSVDHERGASLKPAERMLVHWFRPLVKAIRADQKDDNIGEDCPGAPVWRPVFRSLKAGRLAVAAMHEAVSLCMANPEGVSYAKLTRAIGRAVFAELHIDILKDDHERRREGSNEPTPWEILQKKFARFTTRRVNWWANKNLEEPVYHVRASVHVGSRLFWLLLGCASATSGDFSLAFHHDRRKDGNKRRSFVRLDRRVFDLIEEGHRVRELLRPRHLPMIVPPYPWKKGHEGKKDHEGGYVRTRTSLISKIKPAQKAAVEDANLGEVYDGLNAVAAPPWRLCRPNHGLAKRIWEEGGGDVTVPRADNLPLPAFVKAADEEEKRRLKAERRAIHKANDQLLAAREEFLLKMQVADLMKDHERFYFPAQLDYRGRSYPIPKYLTHYGDDLCRGLLEIADPKPVTEEGRWWIKVHAANCYGIDKVPFADRVRWVEANMGRIARAVEDPDSDDWWKGAKKGKKAWQFLAACRALVDDNAAARLPIRVDGTCNGLQHYTALGRDQDGAANVNMLPADAPRGVYDVVAGAVLPLVAADAELGAPWAVAMLDKIDKDLVKQTTMTTVYGVTEIGARLQISNRLKEMGFSDEDRYHASFYLADLTLRGIGDVCAAARRIMDWLRGMAKQIATKGRAVAWTNPCGLPVIQPYKRWATTRVRTVTQTVTLAYDHSNLPVAVKKQVDGFAPNFVHGLDAAHMFLTARAARDAGLWFAAVHDGYLTHASDMGRLAAILRVEFVRLHERPLLEDLRSELQKQHPDLAFPPPPEPGTYDLGQVAYAPYFFS